MSENTVGTETKKVTGWGRKYPKKGNKIILLFIILFLFAACIFAFKNFQTSSTCNGKDNNQTYVEASRVLNPQAANKLKNIVDTIQKSKGYTKDPNCMYIVTIYYLNISDSVNSRSNYEIYKKVYDPKLGLSKPLNINRITSENLSQQVEILENANQQGKENDKLFGQPVR